MSIETNPQTTGRRGDDDFGTPPQSRVEMVLMKETIKPQSRIEKLLLEGGGGGTSNVQGIHLEINPLTFVMTMWLIDGEGTKVGQEQSIDLPIEATVIGMSYDDSTRTLILTLVSGATLSVPIGAIIYGLQPLIDAQHKLDASLVDDTQGRYRFTWVGTQAQEATDSATIPLGTPVLITDDTDIDTTPTAGSSNPVTSDGIKTALDSKVDNVTGKQLSTEDYTTAEKTKLGGIEAEANKTIIDSALDGTSTNPVQNKVVKTALDEKVDSSDIVTTDKDSFDALVTKTAKLYFVYPTPAVNASLQSAPRLSQTIQPTDLGKDEQTEPQEVTESDSDSNSER